MSRDAREAASDRRSTFGTAMTREQIEALSDDPDEMAQQLQDMAGGNAVIRVDSFEGGRLPPKSAIKAIHITRDAFAAENHYAGGLFIDIITQPGIGPLRTNMNMRFRDGSLSGDPARAAPGRRSREGARRHAVLQRRHRRVADQAEGVVLDQRQQQHLVRHALPALLHARRRRWSKGSRRAGRATTCSSSACSTTRSPRTRRCASTSATTSRRSKNLGVGSFDLVERGYAHRGPQQHAAHPGGGTARPPLLHQHARVDQLVGFGLALASSRDPTIRVLDGFTSGGQQRKGGRDARRPSTCSRTSTTCAASTRCAPACSSTAASYHSNDSTNYLGTYTFESLVAFRNGTPQSYTIRIGDPNIAYKNLQARRSTCRTTSGSARTSRSARASATKRRRTCRTTTTSGRASA